MVASPALASIPCYDDGTQDSGAVYRIYFPDNWNGDLVVFAHSYVSLPGSPMQIDDDDGKLYIPPDKKIPGSLSSGCIHRHGIRLRSHEL